MRISDYLYAFFMCSLPLVKENFMLSLQVKLAGNLFPYLGLLRSVYKFSTGQLDRRKATLYEPFLCSSFA